jgi:demethylmenaquinone methyltransferase / 2-methoxy-6-polyprenyl-1,4-benzoquinol methylase
VPAPHPPLETYYASERDRSAWVRGIFDRTAADYDRLEHILGLGTGSWYRERALRQAGLAPGMSVIDVGTGTGLLAAAAARIVGDPALVTGVDPSAGMIGHARVPPGVRLLSGSAESIPAEDGSADFLSLGYALRHVSDLGVAFGEFHRVLRPGGRVCLLEITRPEGAVSRAILKAWLNGLVPAIATLVARRESARLMHYYWDTIAACAPPATILAALPAAGFDDAERHVELGIFSAYRARKAASPPARPRAG